MFSRDTVWESRIVHRKPVICAAFPGVATVALTRGLFATIDVADAEAVGQYLWHAGDQNGKHYPINAKAGKLHRFLWKLWGLPATPEIDHINGDELDNRRANLRPCTHAQNQQNQRGSGRLGVKGVTPHRGKFKAQIKTNGRVLHLGIFDDPQAAHAAYAAAARKHFGEFANPGLAVTTGLKAAGIDPGGNHSRTVLKVRVGGLSGRALRLVRKIERAIEAGEFVPEVSYLYVSPVLLAPCGCALAGAQFVSGINPRGADAENRRVPGISASEVDALEDGYEDYDADDIGSAFYLAGKELRKFHPYKAERQ